MARVGKVMATRKVLIGALSVMAATVLVMTSAVATLAATPQDDVKAASALIDRARAAAQNGDLATAKARYQEYENTWLDIEDGVRATSRDSYRAIESAMRGVTAAFAKIPADQKAVINALSALDEKQDAFIETAPTSSAGTGPAATANGGQVTMEGAVGLLKEAQAALGRGDYATANERLKGFNTAWMDVEGQVKTRSADDYRQTEVDAGLATTLIGQKSPQAGEVITRMADRLQPYTQSQSYGIFDATIILLREGLEALLVVVALTAFLKRADNHSGQVWVWSGAGAGLLLSIALGLAIQAFFGAIINPGNREIMEGSIGLVAAVMLIYVSYWLHSKSSLGGWQSYIRTHTRDAIGGGRMAGLALLAFLAVFREGAETSLFYLGMVNAISTSDLLIGLALGAVLLLALGVLMVGVGLRIPVRPFFTVASVLVFYLCFKFTGTGFHALQVAGVLPSASAAYLPSVDAIGLYPTWITTAAQLVLVLVAAAILLRERLAGHAEPADDRPQAPRPLATSAR